MYVSRQIKIGQKEAFLANFGRLGGIFWGKSSIVLLPAPNTRTGDVLTKTAHQAHVTNLPLPKNQKFRTEPMLDVFTNKHQLIQRCCQRSFLVPYGTISQHLHQKRFSLRHIQCRNWYIACCNKSISQCTLIEHAVTARVSMLIVVQCLLPKNRCWNLNLQ